MGCTLVYCSTAGQTGLLCRSGAGERYIMSQSEQVKRKASSHIQQSPDQNLHESLCSHRHCCGLADRKSGRKSSIRMTLHLLLKMSISLASNRDKNCSKNGRYPIELILNNAFHWSKCATRRVRGSRGE